MIRNSNLDLFSFVLFEKLGYQMATHHFAIAR